MAVLKHRIPEPELMDSHEQALAYGKADFSQPHEMFVSLVEKRIGSLSGNFLDLGCGTCDITIRFAKRFPKVFIVAVDGSVPMLEFAKKDVTKHRLSDRIKIVHKFITSKECFFDISKFDGAIATSLLHHLHDPMTLWQCLKRNCKQNGYIFVMDLMRPKTTEIAQEIVEKYSGTEPEILKKDFYHSLLAAYTPEEIRCQLEAANLQHLQIEIVSDRHIFIWGKI